VLIPLLCVALGATPLTLEDVRAASRQQLDAVRAELDLKRAEQGTRVSTSAIYPQVNLQLGASDTMAGQQKAFPTGISSQPIDVDGFNQGNFQLSLGVRQLIYDGGRWWNQIAQSGAQEESARGQLLEQQLSSELEAVRRFYDLLKAQLALKVLESSVARSREQVDRALALYEAGRGPRSGWYDAQTNLSADQVNVVRQRQRITQARLALLQWLGRPDADVEAIAPAGLDTPASLVALDDALSQAKSSRPLVKALERTLAAAKLGTDLATSAYLPRIAASATYSRGSPTAGVFFDPTRQHTLTLGASLSWDLFNGFGQQAQVEQARIEVTRAEAQQRQSLLDLEAELRRAHDSASVELEVLKLSSGSLGIAEEQLKLEEARFAAGAGSSLEVRNAQIKFTQAQLSVLSGRADVAVARAALARTTGGEKP
jgi:outer membrane protein TolC